MIVFDDLIADMISNKKLNPIATKLFIRGRKLNNYLVFSYNLILLYGKILEQTKASTNRIIHSTQKSSEFQVFMNLYKNCTTKPYLFLVIDTNLSSDNASCFRKNFLERI